MTERWAPEEELPEGSHEAAWGDEHLPEGDEEPGWDWDASWGGAPPRGHAGATARTGPRHRPGRRPARRGRRVLAWVAATLGVLVLALALFGIHLEHEISPGGRPGRLVSVTIPAGASTARIGRILAGAGVISGPTLFHYYVGLRGDGPLLPGTYRLASHESYSAAIAALTKGPPIVVERLVIPEGYTLAQIAARVQALPGLGLRADKLLAAASSGQVRSRYEPPGVDDLEGLVYPATYDIRQGMTEADVLTLLVQKFDDEAAAVGLEARAAALGYTPYQVVTVASIVEREAKLAADRPGVASAIYNRLRVGMALGADSTLVYALRLANPSVDIATVDYNQPSPYNTRIHKGLPPTPIANPGLPSLQAATSPPSTSYLYFVETNPDGQLSFASTVSGFDHLQAECRAAHLC